jgi:hypothetical protein
MPGPDLPAPHEPFDVAVWLHRWPTGAEKAELFGGVLVFSGEFDERDVDIARHARPGRQIILNESRGIEVHQAVIRHAPCSASYGRNPSCPR